MFICNSCGEAFEQPKVIEEHHPYGMTTATEEWNVCPYCEDTDYSPAQQCERCGELVAELQDGLCDCCYGDVYGI